jgi:uncharacterized membrane protein
MEPVIVLVASFLLFWLAGRLSVRRRLSAITCLRIAFALMFLLMASAHFFGPRRADLIAMVPPALPEPAFLVALTGIAEIAGALGLLHRRTAPWAALALAVLLLALLPANVHAAQEHLMVGGSPEMAVRPRILLQAVFIVGLLVAGYGDRPLPTPTEERRERAVR